MIFVSIALIALACKTTEYIYILKTKKKNKIYSSILCLISI